MKDGNQIMNDDDSPTATRKNEEMTSDPGKVSYSSWLLAPDRTHPTVDTTTSSSVAGKRKRGVESDSETDPAPEAIGTPAPTRARRPCRHDDVEGGKKKDCDSAETNEDHEIVDIDTEDSISDDNNVDEEEDYSSGDNDSIIPDDNNVDEEEDCSNGDNDSVLVPSGKFHARWEENFQLLVEYEKKHKTITMPYIITSKLQHWMNNQRARHRDGKLSEYRVQRLKSIGFVFKNSRRSRVPSGRHHARWEGKFQLLVEYEKKHKTTTMPYSVSPLGQWITNQRSNYRDGKLTEYRVHRLNSIGFVWQVKSHAPQAPWMEMYNRLLSYRDQHDGSTNVPQTSIEYHRLGGWVHKQRYNYQQGVIPNERITFLESIGFQWQLKKKWMVMYQRLEAYKMKYKNTCVPHGYMHKVDPQLDMWVRNQRHYCKVKERIDLLNDIGFAWDGKEIFSK